MVASVTRIKSQQAYCNQYTFTVYLRTLSTTVGPLSLVSTIEEILGRKGSGSSLENWEYGRRDPSRWKRGTLYPQELALASPTSGSRSGCIVLLRTKAMESTTMTMQCRTVPWRADTELKGMWKETVVAELTTQSRKWHEGICSWDLPNTKQSCYQTRLYRSETLHPNIAYRQFQQLAPDNGILNIKYIHLSVITSPSCRQIPPHQKHSNSPENRTKKC
jgi:hypothetical protein